MISPQTAFSTPGPPTWFTVRKMTEEEGKEAFTRLSVDQLKKKFGLSRSTVYYWKQHWGMTGSTGLSPAEYAELARTRRNKKAAEVKAEHTELVQARAELLQLRAENAVQQRLIRDLTLEVARLGGGKKKP